MFYKFIIAVLLILTPTLAGADSCEGGQFHVDQQGAMFGFCWDKNPEQFVGGYRLYRKSPQHTTWEFYRGFDTSICGETVCDTGPVIEAVDLGYYDWSVTAFDTDNFESDNSNTVQQLVQQMPSYAYNLEFEN